MYKEKQKEEKRKQVGRIKRVKGQKVGGETSLGEDLALR